MPDHERNNIVKLLEAQNRKHEELVATITELTKKVDANIELTKPMVQVYESLNGFGSIVAWIFKWVLIPGATIVGILLTAKKLKGE